MAYIKPTPAGGHSPWKGSVPFSLTYVSIIFTLHCLQHLLKLNLSLCPTYNCFGSPRPHTRACHSGECGADETTSALRPLRGPNAWAARVLKPGQWGCLVLRQWLGRDASRAEGERMLVRERAHEMTVSGKLCLTGKKV